MRTVLGNLTFLEVLSLLLVVSTLAGGITDTAIACGAATALIYGATRVEAGSMSLQALLIILMLGIEIFRPMRELRTVLHQGMVGLSAAQGIYRILDDAPSVADAAPASSDAGSSGATSAAASAAAPADSGCD